MKKTNNFNVLRKEVFPDFIKEKVVNWINSHFDLQHIGFEDIKKRLYVTRNDFDNSRDSSDEEENKVSFACNLKEDGSGDNCRITVFNKHEAIGTYIAFTGIFPPELKLISDVKNTDYKGMGKVNIPKKNKYYSWKSEDKSNWEDCFTDVWSDEALDEYVLNVYGSFHKAHEILFSQYNDPDIREDCEKTVNWRWFDRYVSVHLVGKCKEEQMKKAAFG